MEVSQSIDEPTQPAIPLNPFEIGDIETGFWADVKASISGATPTNLALIPGLTKQYKRQAKEIAKLTLEQLRHEFILIQNKKSGLSSTQRDMITHRFLSYVQARRDKRAEMEIKAALNSETVPEVQVLTK